MLGFTLSRPQRHPTPAPSIQSLAASDAVASEPSQHTLKPQSLAVLEIGQKKTFFAQPWTRRGIVIFSVLISLGVALLALVITLPIILTRHYAKMSKDLGDCWAPYRPEHDDPSYKIADNRPIYAIHNFPDPGLIQHNGTWYAFGTNPKKNDPDTIHVPVATSTNFVNWTLHDGYDAMPTIGNWEKEVNHWAPDVIQRVCGFCTPSRLQVIEGTLRAMLTYHPRTTESSFFTTRDRPRTLESIIVSALQCLQGPIP